MSTEIIQLAGKTITLKVEDFSNNEIDMEDILQVDINNIVADIVTFPVIFNRISLIKSEIEDLYDREKLALDILEAQKYNHYHLFLIYEEEIITSSGKETGKMKKFKPTETSIKSAITIDKEIIEKKIALLEIRKQSKIVDGFYWSAKSKEKKLDTVSAKMKPEEFEMDILTGTINGVLIRSRESLIK